MTSLESTQKDNVLPRHIAVIMDGNGRWAKQRGLSRLEGHYTGVERIYPVAEYLNNHKVEYLTLYGFSTENWRRPLEEVRGLMRLLEGRIHKETERLHAKNMRLRHLGQIAGLSKNLQNAINSAIDLTRNNTGLNLNLAFNYGGRTEIIDAVRRIITDNVPQQSLDESLFASYLYTAGLPDVDLLIRTGGELRLSNFLIWQCAYAEYYFTPVLWPDFDTKDIEDALSAYSRRQRRFGGINQE